MASQSTLISGTGYGNTYVDSLVWGCAWVGGPITYYFASGSVPATDSAVGAFTGAGWSPAEQAAFGIALAQYSAVSNLEFAPAASQAEANMVWWLAPSSVMGAGGLGMHEVPDGENPQTSGYFNYQHATWSNLTPGSYGFTTVIHELGHGMGLAHPHDGGGESDATRFPGVNGPWSIGTSGLNQGIWTSMSYNDGWTSAPSPSPDYGYQASLMAFDIAALQALYGVNISTRTGDDVYVLPSSSATGTGWTCIWDAAGRDTISNAGSALACTINLNAAPLVGSNAGGFVSRDAGVFGGYTIANGALIENAIGGSGNDALVGNTAANRLDGGLGQDTMTGGGGNDVYLVDNSRDMVTETAGGGTDTIETSVAITLPRDVEILVLSGSANIAGTGNASNNSLFGNAGNNTLNGSSGNDQLSGGGGVDLLIGGKGGDVFVFAGSDSGVGVGLRDIVSDFRGLTGDRIDLSAIDASTTTGGDQSFTFIGSLAFSLQAGELRFASQVLSGDVNGDGVADFEIQLSGVRSVLSEFLIL